MTIDSKEIDLQRLELDKKKSEQDYEIRLKEYKLKEIEVKRSRWANPLAIPILAAAIAAGANVYVSWLNGANQADIESTRYATQRELERERAESDRILEATKSSDLKDAALRIKFLIDVGLISDPNRQADLEAYLKSRDSTTSSAPGRIVPYQSGWLGGGTNQTDQCAIGRVSIAEQNQGKTILLQSSSEESRRDFWGRVEYRYSCEFEVK
jgi:hypothetical protein